MHPIRNRYLIINADDFGLDQGINRGILHACREGVVRSVSLAAVGEAFDDAVCILKGMDGIGVGAHLCLVAEKPVLPAASLPSLVDKTGRFHAGIGHLLSRFWSGRVRMDEIEKELAAQLGRICDQGINVTHIDGHQYIQLVPEILRVMIGLARKYRIRWVRYPSGPLMSGHANWPGLAKRLWSGVFAGRHVEMIRKAGLRCPDLSHGWEITGCLRKQNIDEIMKRVTSGVNDLVCHPGERPALGRYHSWKYAWEREMGIFADPDLARLVATHNIKLANYGSVQGLL